MASIELMTPATLERMRPSCALAADTLVRIGEIIRPGITTVEIDRFAHDRITKAEAYPSPLHYVVGDKPPFPKSVCTSINDVICHGIPSKQVLRAGDIINVDVTTYFPARGGFHGDTSATFYVGEPSDEARHVTEVARRCLEIGIAVVRADKRIGDIGAAIQAYAESVGCSVVRDYVGHGVGREFHMPPQIPHFGKAGKGKRLKAGMVFTIEPMINLGSYEGEEDERDKWTVRTKDGKLSAQFEHTITVTRDGCEVLTARKEILKNSEDRPWSQVGPLSAPAAWRNQQANETPIAKTGS